MTEKTLISFAAAGLGSGLLSWLVLRRARRPAPVSAGPVVAGVGALWFLVAWRWLSGAWPGWWLPIPLVVTALAVPLVMADLRHQRLPDVLTMPAYPLVGLAVALAALGGAGAGLAVRAVLGAAVFGGLHLLVHALSRGGLGAGDVKLAGPVGAALGAVSWVAVTVGAVLAALGTVLMAALPRWRGGTPHGPGLLVAVCLVTVFPGAGSEVMRWR
jgi:leader peptidase (prepilin peptidase) / N-methyltransferase